MAATKLHMKAAALHRKQRNSMSAGENRSPGNASEHTFVCLFPSKTSQTQQFTRGGMFLCCDFTLYSSLRCLKNASDKYWMSKRQRKSFKCGRLFECQPTHFGNCGIFLGRVISDSQFLKKKSAECKSVKWGFPIKVHSCFSLRELERRSEWFQKLSRKLFCSLN